MMSLSRRIPSSGSGTMGAATRPRRPRRWRVSLVSALHHRHAQPSEQRHGQVVCADVQALLRVPERPAGWSHGAGKLPRWIEESNGFHPHNGLRMRSPWEHRRAPRRQQTANWWCLGLAEAPTATRNGSGTPSPANINPLAYEARTSSPKRDHRCQTLKPYAWNLCEPRLNPNTPYDRAGARHDLT